MKTQYVEPPAGTTISQDRPDRWRVGHTTVEQIWQDTCGRSAPKQGTYVISSGGYLYPDRETAAQVAIEIANIAAARAVLQHNGISDGPYSRERYEAACALLEVDPIDDGAIIEEDYGIRYGDFAPPEYTAEHCVAMTLAYRRLTALDKERPELATTTDAAEVTGHCDRCGMAIYNEGGLIANRGVACSTDCYEHLS